ncbi:MULTISPECIES: hypothetical protein [Paracoccaceae]|uniref:hypothetical protein n=1 Tax=Paracoccaceae TaxID=31989 RepID=UPI0020206DCF|nr:hypothetical protein [Phaeovulum sp. NW3]MCL7465562.1 hypothetical protein [Phaeovulum sp. NW3]
MVAFVSNENRDKTSRPQVNWREVAAALCDLLGAASIFATGYLFLLIGHGLGLD